MLLGQQLQQWLLDRHIVRRSLQLVFWIHPGLDPKLVVVVEVLPICWMEGLLDRKIHPSHYVVEPHQDDHATTLRCFLNGPARRHATTSEREPAGQAHAA